MPSQSVESRQRPSIEERAERRRELQRTHPDRYSGLLGVLLGNRRGDRGRLLSDPVHWHPIAPKLAAGALIVVAVVVAAVVAHGIMRQDRIDTWTGPTATVTSGQRVLACLPGSAVTDEYLPTWIRYDGRVFAKTNAVRALRAGGTPGETGQIETDYRLGQMRILLPAEQPADEPPTRLLVALDLAPAATQYELAPACE